VEPGVVVVVKACNLFKSSLKTNDYNSGGREVKSQNLAETIYAYVMETVVL
jgi:hypothetical protein